MPPEISLDADGLLRLDAQWTMSTRGIYIPDKGTKYFLPYDKMCSSYPFHVTGGLWDLLAKLPRERVRVRPDTSFVDPPSGFLKTAVKIWGAQFNLAHIAQSRSPQEVNHLDPDKQNGNHRLLQCAWYPQNEKGQVQIEIEVMMPGTPTTRYLHAMLKPETMQFEHVDGAIKDYETNAYADRCSSTLLKSAKSTHYRKVFRYDGEISAETWFPLAEAFFHPEPLLKELFEKI